MSIKCVDNVRARCVLERMQKDRTGCQTMSSLKRVVLSSFSAKGRGHTASLDLLTASQPVAG